MVSNEFSSGSQFNMAIPTLERIDNLLRYLQELWVRDKLPHIGTGLFELYKEVDPFLNDKERQEGNKQWSIIESAKIRRVANSKQYRIPKGYRHNLHNFERWIRIKLKKKGLLMKESDDPTKAMGR